MSLLATLLRRKPMHMMQEDLQGEQRLKRVLGPVALTTIGVGGIIGTGIFVLTGIAAHDKAGPSLMLSFVFAGLTCLLAALCYAEFASMVPLAGSAYTYAYATLGELFAWIIGWDLVLEYTVAAATVSHGWSHYFQDFISIFNIHIPKVWSWAPFGIDAKSGEMIASGSWVDLPALIIVALITFILIRGIKESAMFNAVMVGIKLVVILVVIGVGFFYIRPENWVPFAPYGLTGISFFGKTIFGASDAAGAPVGMLAGAAISFFAYLGFDAVSTQAEEAKKPQRDLPIAIIGSLIICTILYILVVAVLTGMVPYQLIDKSAPVSNAFKQVGLPWAQFLVSAGALAGITSVLIVLLLSQPRIFMAMARDGLLPKRTFAAIHPRFKTPWKATLINALVVSLLASLLPLEILAELVNIGTLLAFVIVCAAVLIMRRTHPHLERPFKAPFFPLVPILGIALCAILMFSLPPQNWLRLIVWLVLGMAIYVFYGRRHSRLNPSSTPEKNH